MHKRQLPITCPICGRKSEYPLEALTERSTIQCPLCRVKLTLHGHMWDEVRAETAKLKKDL